MNLNGMSHTSAVQRYLSAQGFRYTRTRKKTRSLREEPSARQQRHTYLYELQKLRNEGYMVVYLDESFIHHHHGQEFSWFEENDYLNRATGKGRRWCFIHALSPTRLLPNCFFIFEGKKSSGDYHGSFNFKVFQNWFTENLIPNLPTKKSCLVMDRATYHLVPKENLVVGEMRKLEIQTWLTEHNIPWESHWLKPKLVEVITDNIDKTPLVSLLSEQHGHKVLLL